MCSSDLAVTATPFEFSRAIRVPLRVPPALNGFGLWIGLMVALTVVNYGVPIVQLATSTGGVVPAVRIGGSR